MRLSLLTLLCLLLHLSAFAASPTTMEIGARGGIDASNSSLLEEYESAEIYFLYRLPWVADLGARTTLSSRFDMSATYLEADGDENGMLGIGADLVLGFCDGCLEFEVGFRPTWMVDHEYGDDDFGGGMQFTSHVGAALNWSNAVLNYRFQHTSNGGLYDENPGLNLHMIGLGYRF